MGEGGERGVGASALDLGSLNEAQREAVLSTEGPLLVLAGAGSGKTRVLTYRIAHLVADLDVAPWRILAITFTNKAAQEMRERLLQTVPGGIRGMWVCTFHAMAVRMLREDAELVGFGENFTIYDDGDSRALLRRLADEEHLDQKRCPLARIRSRISTAKMALVDPSQFLARAAKGEDFPIARIYERYQAELLRTNAMDFDDLLVNAYRLLSRHESVLARYQERFRYVSVDEYQDTNRVQYLITNLLAAGSRNLMVVGDDDQSIYSWRGADIQNILDFKRDYPEATVVKLERNYRSTAHILEAANAVVRHNLRREPKHLYTEGGAGELIGVYRATDEQDEGRWIASEIERLHRRGLSYDDVAVFYRTNAQSRTIEDMFLRAGVPYKIVGGTRFFDRAEVRDVMAYLRLVVNPADDVSARRVVNVPRRGVGEKSMAAIDAVAARYGVSFFEAAQLAVGGEGELTPRVREALGAWTSAIEEARRYTGELSRVVEMIIAKSGMLEELENTGTPQALARAENIREFFLIAEEFDESHEVSPAALLAVDDLEAGPAEEAAFAPDAVSSEKLPAFLEWLALRSDLDALSGQTSAVTLMTVHAAKGLEFPAVFVAGLEEGLFPHRGPQAEQKDVEEERRLAYVAITRARRRLYLTYAEKRRTWGSTQASAPSRFLKEIPREHLRSEGTGSLGFEGTGWEKRGDRHGTFGSGTGSYAWGARSTTAGKVTPKAPAAATLRSATRASKPSFAVGDAVAHKTFGQGTVLAVEGDIVEVRFKGLGASKRLMLGFAPLVKVDDAS